MAIDSILDSTKKALGIAPDYDVFDPEIIMHINSVFSTLHQLGIGPEAGFEIEDAEVTWDQYLGNDRLLNSVRTYMYLKVKTVFDPPSTSFALNAMKEQIQEHEWRLTVYHDGKVWAGSTTIIEEP